jgi:hypothetical protein
MKKFTPLVMLVFLMVSLGLGGWTCSVASADNSATVRNDNGPRYFEFSVDSTADAGEMAVSSGGVEINSEYLIDEKNYKYGVNYWVDSSADEDMYVKVWVTVRSNVTGDVVSGPFLVNANQKGVSIGSFKATVYGTPWKVVVNGNFCPVSAPPEQCK